MRCRSRTLIALNRMTVRAIRSRVQGRLRRSEKHLGVVEKRRKVQAGPHLVRERMKNGHKRCEPARDENLRGTRDTAESPMLTEPPDSDYGTAGED